MSSLLLSILEEKLDAGVFVQGSFGDATYFIDHLPLLLHKHVARLWRYIWKRENCKLNSLKKKGLDEGINLICTYNNHARYLTICDWRVLSCLSIQVQKHMPIANSCLLNNFSAKYIC